MKNIGTFIQKYSLIIMILLLVTVFAILNENFLSLSGFQNILEQNAALAVVTVGTTFLVISGVMDLSPGSVVALSGVVIGLIFRSTGNIVVSLLGGVFASVFIGFFNGIIVTQFKVNPVIVTLAAMTWARGLSLALTEKASIIIDSPFIGMMNTRFGGLISIPILLIIICYIAGDFFLNHTRMGRYTFAIGGNERSTRAAGIPVDWYKVLIFVFGGIFVGLASIITVGRQGAATPNAMFGLELDAIVAVIIGGNKLDGGEGRIQNTILGLLFLAILNNGLSTLGLRDAYFYFYKGIVILVALCIGVISQTMMTFGDRASSQKVLESK